MSTNWPSIVRRDFIKPELAPPQQPQPAATRLAQHLEGTEMYTPEFLPRLLYTKSGQLNSCCRWCSQDGPPWKSLYQAAFGHSGAWTRSFIQITWEQKSSPVLVAVTTAIALQQIAVCSGVMAFWSALHTEGLDIWEQTYVHACSLEAKNGPAFLRRSSKSLLCGDCSCLCKLLRLKLSQELYPLKYTAPL